MNVAPPNCERHELLISTWVDEDLERAEERELLDHLVRCPDCREFYAAARSLDGLVAFVSEEASAEAPPPEIWDRITTLVERPETTESWPSWAWRAAAALLLGAALAFAPWPSAARPEGRSGRQMEVVLEEDRGHMTESRFLEIAAEILRADRRYHFAMQKVMEKVIDDEWRSEGASSEGLSEEATKDDDEDKGSSVRV